jgi:hypothetical protein
MSSLYWRRRALRRLARENGAAIAFVAGLCIGAFAYDFFSRPVAASAPPPTASFTEAPPSAPFRTCAAAHAAGAAPIYRGEPGYGPHLDRDDDGIACEPYRR